MKAKIFSLEGVSAKTAELPPQFSEEIREEIIRRAVLSDETKLYQPQGSFYKAGFQTSARYRGRKEDYGSLKNRGQARLPREVRPKGNWGKVRRIPSSLKGHRAHPPKVEKRIVELVNRKEYKKALRSALAATASPALARARGHLFDCELPLVFENKLESLSKTKEVLSALEKLAGKDLERARSSRKPRSGTRSRKAGTRTAKSLLLVVSGGSILKSARNIPGVDVVQAEKLRVKDLAPGTHPGRFTLYTENALKKIHEVL
ncbi:MAG: 50S ribosomal protein L4 [Candidatus Micrarchaeota archaeon]